MGDVTEIYICKEGQDLKAGKLEYSDDITERGAAQSDAEMRCARDNTIHKIAYYATREDGRFSCFYTHVNPNAVGATAAPQRPGTAKPRKKARRKKKPPKPTLMARILAVFK